jgi:uncharacterized protein (TIGR02996 family)
MLRGMSDSRQALFQAVLDRPGDDAPRFAYAGYCDAQGDPYGAFIRTQLARTQALRYGSDEDANQLREEANELRYRHRSPAWTNGIEKLVKHPTFIRGFVDRVFMDARTYFEHADELYELAPVRQLSLTGAGDFAQALAQNPHLSQITWLSLSEKPTIGDAGLAAIAASPYLRGLRVLEAGLQAITMVGLEALCASKQLPALIYVNLTGNKFEDPIDSYSTDWMNGRIVQESVTPRTIGEELEEKYGELAWLHGPLRLRHFPPEPDEF